MNATKWRQLRSHWTADLYRCSLGKADRKAAIDAYRKNPGFKFLFWLRLAAGSRESTGVWRVLHLFARLMHRRYRFKFGISIPYNTHIGTGFYIGHFGGIVVNELAEIGCNCNISQGVTIGQANRGERKGVPVIGNGVYIGPGAKIIGRIRIGNNCAIGANAVVTKDLPDGAVAVGVPARVISLDGAGSYIEYTEYPNQP